MLLHVLLFGPALAEHTIVSEPFTVTVPAGRFRHAARHEATTSVAAARAIFVPIFMFVRLSFPFVFVKRLVRVRLPRRNENSCSHWLVNALMAWTSLPWRSYQSRLRPS